jgi:hypothetical protein
MTADSSSSFSIQTIVVDTESIAVSNNNPEKDETITITAESTASF